MNTAPDAVHAAGAAGDQAAGDQAAGDQPQSVEVEDGEASANGRSDPPGRRGLRLARGGWLWLAIAALVIAADQVSKAWIAAHFTVGETRAVLPVLDITLRLNTGAAFSMLADASGWQRWFFSGLAIAIALGIIIWLLRMDSRRQRLQALALSLVLAGAVGNLIDRLRLGHVIDFVSVHWKAVYYFPAFNVADSAITVGAILWLLDAWVGGRRRSE